MNTLKAAWKLVLAVKFVAISRFYRVVIKAAVPITTRAMRHDSKNALWYTMAMYSTMADIARNKNSEAERKVFIMQKGVADVRRTVAKARMESGHRDAEEGEG